MAQPRLGSQAEVEDEAMEYGIFNLMGSREADKPTAQVFGEVAEQTRLADELGYTIAWFAEHHFSNLLPVRFPLDDGGALRLDHQADPARHRRRGVAPVQPGAARRRDRHGRRLVEWPTDARRRRRVPAHEFERFGTDIAQNLEMTEEVCDILDLAFSRDFFS